MTPPLGQHHWRTLVEECFRREAGMQSQMPEPPQDLIETGALDSMGWVSFLRTLESATGVSNLGSSLADRTPSFESIYVALDNSCTIASSPDCDLSSGRGTSPQVVVNIVGSAAALGSRKIPSEEVDTAFRMSVGKLRRRAGIESLAYAAEGEDELWLAANAAQSALRAVGCGAQELDWIIATSETHCGYPSLAAQLHSRLLARETCAALDVGGACLGLLNGFAVAQGLVACGQARTILAVTSDVHSRILAPGRVPGEFGGLFGDGASAFLLSRASVGPRTLPAYNLGQFFFGCAGQYAGAIRVAAESQDKLDLHFDGEALSRAAITQLEKMIFDLEQRSGIERSSVQGFATHQPNPRLMSLLAKQCGVAEERFPATAKAYGNLGSSTCGVALDAILSSAHKTELNRRGPIFLASLGPGLLFGGGWLVPV